MAVFYEFSIVALVFSFLEILFKCNSLALFVRSWPSAKSSAGPSALQSSRPPSAAESSAGVKITVALASAVINNKELV